MDMYKRLKRLEKFEDQLKQKNKVNKPKLNQGGSGVLNNYGGYEVQVQHDPNMDLDELAKHLSIKVSYNQVF